MEVERHCQHHKRYASSVVTIISMDNASMNTRNRIISSLHGIALIKFYDQEYKGESAVDCFCEIARQNGTNAPESEIEKSENPIGRIQKSVADHI